MPRTAARARFNSRVDAEWDKLTDYLDSADPQALWVVASGELSPLPRSAQWLLRVGSLTGADLRLMCKRQIIRAGKWESGAPDKGAPEWGGARNLRLV